MATTTPNFGWDIPQSTDLVKDGATAIAALGTDIDTALVDLKGGTTGQVLSKASNTDLDFTWSSVDPLTILDAKGDLISATAADTPARLASSGVNGDILTVDTSTATGLKWAAPAASGGMTLISETVASANSSLSLSSIPSTYKNLVLTWSGIYHSASGNRFQIRFNNDSSSIYSMRLAYDQNSTFTTYGDDGATGISGTSAVAPFGRDSTSTTISETASGYLYLENYASTTKFKNFNGAWKFFEVGGSNWGVWNDIGTYKSTSAITSIDVVRVTGTGTFSNASDTSIRLYGVS